LAFVLSGKTLVAAASLPYTPPVQLWEVDYATTLKAEMVNVMFRPAKKKTPEPATPVVSWDVSGLQTQRPTASSAIDLLWEELGARDAELAYQASCRMADHPDTLAVLRERIQPAPAPDPQHIAKLIADLENPGFAVRQRAALELARLGEAAA